MNLSLLCFNKIAHKISGNLWVVNSNSQSILLATPKIWRQILETTQKNLEPHALRQKDVRGIITIDRKYIVLFFKQEYQH